MEDDKREQALVGGCFRGTLVASNSDRRMPIAEVRLYKYQPAPTHTVAHDGDGVPSPSPSSSCTCFVPSVGGSSLRGWSCAHSPATGSATLHTAAPAADQHHTADDDQPITRKFRASNRGRQKRETLPHVHTDFGVMGSSVASALASVSPPHLCIFSQVRLSSLTPMDGSNILFQAPTYWMKSSGGEKSYVGEREVMLGNEMFISLLSQLRQNRHVALVHFASSSPSTSACVASPPHSFGILFPISWSIGCLKLLFSPSILFPPTSPLTTRLMQQHQQHCKKDHTQVYMPMIYNKGEHDGDALACSSLSFSSPSAAAAASPPAQPHSQRRTRNSARIHAETGTSELDDTPTKGDSTSRTSTISINGSPLSSSSSSSRSVAGVSAVIAPPSPAGTPETRFGTIGVEVIHTYPNQAGVVMSIEQTTRDERQDEDTFQLYAQLLLDPTATDQTNKADQPQSSMPMEIDESNKDVSDDAPSSSSISVSLSPPPPSLAAIVSHLHSDWLRVFRPPVSLVDSTSSSCVSSFGPESVIRLFHSWHGRVEQVWPTRERIDPDQPDHQTTNTINQHTNVKATEAPAPAAGAHATEPLHHPDDQSPDDFLRRHIMRQIQLPALQKHVAQTKQAERIRADVCNLIRWLPLDHDRIEFIDQIIQLMPELEPNSNTQHNHETQPRTWRYEHAMQLLADQLAEYDCPPCDNRALHLIQRWSKLRLHTSEAATSTPPFVPRALATIAPLDAPQPPLSPPHVGESQVDPLIPYFEARRSQVVAKTMPEQVKPSHRGLKVLKNGANTATLVSVASASVPSLPLPPSVSIVLPVSNLSTHHAACASLARGTRRIEVSTLVQVKAGKVKPRITPAPTVTVTVTPAVPTNRTPKRHTGHTTKSPRRATPRAAKRKQQTPSKNTLSDKKKKAATNVNPNFLSPARPTRLSGVAPSPSPSRFRTPTHSHSRVLRSGGGGGGELIIEETPSKSTPDPDADADVDAALDASLRTLPGTVRSFALPPPPIGSGSTRHAKRPYAHLMSATTQNEGSPTKKQNKMAMARALFKSPIKEKTPRP